MSSSQLNVVILGRPNVGKSTLFNRLCGKKKALVLDRPGVTRDRLEATCLWQVNGKNVRVRFTDTGGMLGEGPFEAEIKNQIRLALEDAHIVLIVFDAQVGVMPTDIRMMKEFRRSGILQRLPGLAVINKVDVESHEQRSLEFSTLGFEEMMTVSAEHDRGIVDLKKWLTHQAQLVRITTFDGDHELQESSNYLVKEDLGDPEIPFRVVIVGKPNVGKSTLTNALLNKEQVVTSPIPGTTTDALEFSWGIKSSEKFNLVDTAGIRRKSKTQKGIECLSVVMTMKEVRNSDIALLVLDGVNGVTEQDEKIAGFLADSGCGIVILVNKWDHQEKNVMFTSKLAERKVRQQIPFLSYAPILFISALKKKGLSKIPIAIRDIIHQRKLKISTQELTRWVRGFDNAQNPKNAKFFMCHQSGRNPPTFICRVNDPKKVPVNLQRHITNQMRMRWGFRGSPIRLQFFS